MMMPSDPVNSEHVSGQTKHKRRSFAANETLLLEASKFLKGNRIVDDSSSNTSDSAEGASILPDGPRRSSRRLTHTFRVTCPSTQLHKVYHEIPNSDDISKCNSVMLDDSAMQALSPCDNFRVDASFQHVQVEMESLQIKTKARQTAKARRRVISKINAPVSDASLNEPDQMDVTLNSLCLAEPDKLHNNIIPVVDSEEHLAAEIVAIYTNKNFVKPENSGLETIEESREEALDNTDASPVRPKRAKGSNAKKSSTKKLPWRFIPHLAVNPPEIWWQEIPVKIQTEIKKKARNAGYRPASKKRMMEAEKRVQIAMEHLDRHFKAEGRHGSDRSCASLTDDSSSSTSSSQQVVCVDSTFDSLKVFVGESSSSLS